MTCHAGLKHKIHTVLSEQKRHPEDISLYPKFSCRYKLRFQKCSNWLITYVHVAQDVNSPEKIKNLLNSCHPAIHPVQCNILLFWIAFFSRSISVFAHTAANFFAVPTLATSLTQANTYLLPEIISHKDQCRNEFCSLMGECRVNCVIWYDVPRWFNRQNPKNC